MRYTSLAEFKSIVPDEGKAIAFVASRKGGGLPRCGICTSVDILIEGKMSYCRACQMRASLLKETLFEHTKIPLRSWLYLMLLMANDSRILPVSYVARHLGVTASSAFRMLACVRLHIEQLHQGLVLGTLGEQVQVDETLIKSVKAGSARSKSGAIVLGIYSKMGVAAIQIASRHRHTIFPELERHIAPGSCIVTDQFRTYASLRDHGFRHVSVNHTRREFVNAEGFSTIGIEGYWANLKFALRSCNITPDYENLQPYLSEHAFKFTCRKRHLDPFEVMTANFPRVDFGKWTRSCNVN